MARIWMALKSIGWAVELVEKSASIVGGWEASDGAIWQLERVSYAFAQTVKYAGCVSGVGKL